MERLLSGLEGRGAVLVAGAGYGKTTLLVQALDGLQWAWAWCSCDPDLADPGDFIRHIAASISESVPGFGAEIRLTGDASAQIAELSNEAVETLSEDFVLVLDDAHRLPKASRGALALLARDLPANVRLLIASRTPLELPSSRSRVGALLEISEPDLVLTADETADLLSRSGGARAQGAIDDLHDQTEGWVAGVALAGRSSDGSPFRPAAFGPMLEEVLANQPDEVRDFMSATCVLERFSPEIAAAVSGNGEAGALARTLVSERLFISRLDMEGEWYRYHHLLSAHLRQRLAEDAPELLEELHARAARAMQHGDEPEVAARHAIAAKDWSLASACLERFAEPTATSPRAPVLAALLDQIPADAYASRPPLLLAKAGLLFGSGDHEIAFAAIEDLIVRLVELGEDERAGLALFRLMQAMAAAGTPPDRRVELGRRHLDRISASSQRTAVVRVMHAANAAYARRFDEAESELAAVLALPDLPPEVRGYAEVTWAHYLGFARDGRPEALEQLDLAIAALSADPERDELAFLPWARMLRCYELLDLGFFEEALDELERVAEDAARRGLSRAPVRSSRWLRPWALLGLGRVEEAGAELFTAGHQGDLSVQNAYSYRYRALASLTAAARGDQATALLQVRLGVDAMDDFGRVSDDPVFLADFALAAWRAGEPDTASALALRAADEAAVIGADWQRLRALIVVAAIHQGSEVGRAALEDALEVSIDPVLEGAWTRREPTLAPALLSWALAEGIGPPGVAGRLVARCGGVAVRSCLERLADADPAARIALAEAAASAQSADSSALDSLLRDRDAGVRAAARVAWTRLRERPRATLRIQTLGGLAIWRDGILVPESAFERQKARILLAVLIVREGPVHREELCELIWPQLGPERAAASLRTTLHDLRRALHPELEATSPASVIAADGETVALVLGDNDQLDARRLLAVSEHPGASVEELQAAEDLWRGAFLPEWPYEDWAAAPRQRLDDAHRSIVARLAEALAERGRPEAAALRWRSLIAMEPQHEGWHRGLMSAYAASGERALALRQFHACRTTLRREQGIEPSAATQVLYRRLLDEDQATPL